MTKKLLTFTDLFHYCLYLEKYLKNLLSMLMKQKWLSEQQSNFRPNDSCTNQVLSIVHDIYMPFDADPTLEVQGVFLDMLKAFEKVWHEGSIYKLRQVGISGEAITLINCFFFNNRFQCVNLWTVIKLITS